MPNICFYRRFIAAGCRWLMRIVRSFNRVRTRRNKLAFSEQSCLLSVIVSKDGADNFRTQLRLNKAWLWTFSKSFFLSWRNKRAFEFPAARCAPLPIPRALFSLSFPSCSPQYTTYVSLLRHYRRGGAVGRFHFRWCTTTRLEELIAAASTRVS